MSPTYLAWGLSLLGSGGSFDLASGAEAMVSSGALAQVPDEEPVPTIEFSLTTLSGLRFASERTSFLLRYAPRTYYQRPNIADVERPLFLHQLDATYTSALTARTNVNWSGQVRAGDVTYANLARTFVGGTAATAAARLPLLFVSSSAGVSHETSARNVVSVGPNVSYRTVLNTLPNPEETQIPTSLNLGLTLSDVHTVSRRNYLGVAVFAEYSQVEEAEQQNSPSDTVFGTALVNFGHRHSLTSQTTLTSGVGAARQIESGKSSFFPLASVEQNNTFRWFGDSFRSSVATGMRGFMDPVLATMRPQGFASMSLAGQHSRTLSTQASVSAWTFLSKQPLEPAQYESNGSVDVAGVYQLGPGFSIRAGVSWQVRAPHLSQPEELALQSQRLGFVSIRGTLGTDREQGNWL